MSLSHSFEHLERWRLCCLVLYIFVALRRGFGLRENGIEAPGRGVLEEAPGPGVHVSRFWQIRHTDIGS